MIVSTTWPLYLPPLPSGKNPGSHRRESGWSSEPPGRFGEKTKLLVAAGIKTSVYPTHDLF